MFGHGCAPRGALGPATAFRWRSRFLSPLQANPCEGCSGTRWEAVRRVLTPLALVCVVCDTNVRQDLETESVAYFPVIWKKLYFSCQQTATDKKTLFLSEKFIKVFKVRYKENQNGVTMLNLNIWFLLLRILIPIINFFYFGGLFFLFLLLSCFWLLIQH